MSGLDAIIEEYENQVGERGVLDVDPRDFIDHSLLNASSGSDTAVRGEVVVELLRVWMEMRWSLPLETTAAEAMAIFPEHSFSDSERRALRYEESRQREIARESIASGGAKLPSLQELPKVGESWGSFRLIHLLGEEPLPKSIWRGRPTWPTDWWL